MGGGTVLSWTESQESWEVSSKCLPSGGSSNALNSSLSRATSDKCLDFCVSLVSLWSGLLFMFLPLSLEKNVVIMYA